MKYYRGNFGEVNTDPSNIVKTAGDLAEKSLTTSLDRVAQIAKSAEIQSFIESNNLAPYLKDITQDRVKTVLALFGLFSVYKVIKSPIGLAIIGSGAIYMMSSNKPKLVDKVSSTLAANDSSDSIDTNLVADIIQDLPGQSINENGNTNEIV